MIQALPKIVDWEFVEGDGDIYADVAMSDCLERHEKFNVRRHAKNMGNASLNL